MSVTLPMTKMRKFFKNKEKVVDELVMLSTGLNKESSYTYYRPHKHSLIYFGNNGADTSEMTFCIDLEYNNVLMTFFYEPCVEENVEYSFAFKWSDDEIETGTEDFFLHPDVVEEQFFQQSLIDDFQFLTLELHQELLRYCNEVQEELRIKLESNRCD